METDIYKTEHTEPRTEEQRRTYEETKQAMSRAYDRTSEALSGTYEQAMSYARENPGKTTLIALGIGVGLGLMLSAGRRSRIRRYGEPIVNALSDVALEAIRNW